MKMSDFTNKKLADLSPEARRAAVDAINDIIASRQKNGGMGSFPLGGGGDVDIDIDPDLNKPEPQNNDDMEDLLDDIDIDINDPEDLLPEEDGKNGKGKGKGKGSSKDDQDSDEKSDDNDNEGDGTGKDGQDKDDNKADTKANGQGQGKDQDKDTNSQNDSGAGEQGEQDSDEDKSGQGSSNQKGTDDNSSDQKNRNGASDNIDFDTGSTNSEQDTDNDKNTSSKAQQEYQGYEENENDPRFDPDDTKQQSGGDIAGNQNKIDYKQHQINRTINEIKETIKAAKNNPKISQDTIDKLEKDLKDLQENKDKYSKMTEDQLGDVLNSYINDIDAVRPVYKTPDTSKRGTRIKKLTNDEKFQKALDDEEFENIRKAALDAEKEKYLKDRENEINKYKNFDTLHDFEIDLYDTIKDQVQEYENSIDSYSRINSRYEDEDNVIMPGELITDEQRLEKPTIQVYYDQSGSWSSADTKRGDKALKVLQEMVEKDLVKIQIYYFANRIATDRNTYIGGGTTAWPQICNNIVNSAAKNVILMTDTDMDSQAASGPVIEVPGCVWIIWKNGQQSLNIAKKLRGVADGSKGNRQYAFDSRAPLDDED